MEFSIISSCLGIVKVFPIILPSNLVNVQRLHEKGNFLCVFNGVLVIYVGCSFMNSANVGSILFAVILTSDTSPVSSKELLEIQATTEWRLSLKGVCVMM